MTTNLQDRPATLTHLESVVRSAVDEAVAFWCDPDEVPKLRRDHICDDVLVRIRERLNRTDLDRGTD